MTRSISSSLSVALVLSALLATGLSTRDAAAGCGCTKPPPPPAAVRPSVTYAGTEVTFFDPALVKGAFYDVTFSSGTGPESRTVTGQAVNRRDLADGLYKIQLNVTLPYMPLGPAAITVRLAATALRILLLPDSEFTVAPQG